MRRNEATVFLILALAWALMVGWQGFEHRRVRDTERAALRTQASATSISISAAIRSAARRRVIPQERMEDILRELSKASGLISLALINAAGEVVASAGDEPIPDLASLLDQGERWNTGSVDFLNPVDFGEQPTSTTTIVLPPFRPGQTAGTLPQGRYQPPQPPPPDGDHRPGHGVAGPRPEDTATTMTRVDRGVGPRPEDALTTPTIADRERGRERGGRPQFRRPPWMDPAHYNELVKSRGLHGFGIRLSRAEYDRAVRADLWQRFFVAIIAALAAAGLAAAWHQTQKTARLQVRLARASQMNLHLQELNLAAAGLAHETRNPLNIIRGLAQLIAQQPASADIHTRAADIAQEVDRVTNRLNEFINYSRPPEPKPTPLNFRMVVLDVVRALESDMADNGIRFEPIDLDGMIEADHALLRQMLFNLLLNSIQAVGRGGCIQVELRIAGPAEAEFEVRDNGPGIPPDQRDLVFRPYFTTRENGTGLGLAVVRQIALAHQWEIECLNGVGARFRIRGIKVPRPAHTETASRK